MVGNLQVKGSLQLQLKTTKFPSYYWLCVDASQATAQRDRSIASRMVSLAQICVVSTTNFLKILIRWKSQKMIPAMEKVISTTKKERMTNIYLHIYEKCLFAILVYVFCLFTFYKGYRSYSNLRFGKQNLNHCTDKCLIVL